MSPLFRRNSALQCFFCQSAVPFTISNVKNFECTSCGCWNRCNDTGEIVSDEPAMHNEHLNAKSFAKRGSPSKNQLPNFYGPGPFCHSCQTNQMLQIHLLSNYLPDPQSPEYESRLDMLPAYRESLDARYPPICEVCMPLVEDEIRRKEQMARVQALGCWLGKGKDRQRLVLNETQIPVRVANDRILFWWKLRGCLWALSAALSIVGNISAIFELQLLHVFAFLQPALPFIVLVSLLWTAWDPTYAKLRYAHQQCRPVRVQGKNVYKAIQSLVWMSRLLCSIFLYVRWFYPDHRTLLRLSSNKTFFHIFVFIELLSLAVSAVVLQIHQPHPVRLVDTNNKFRPGSLASRSTTPLSAPPPKPSAVESENDVLAALSLSSNPALLSPRKAVFGHPSLKGSSHVIKEEMNSEDMDWTPTNLTSSSAFTGGAKRITETENWLRPQRFFAPEKTTGLEGLLEGARIRDDPMVVDSSEARQRSGEEIWLIMQHLRQWHAMLYALGIATLVLSFLLAKEIPWSWRTKS